MMDTLIKELSVYSIYESLKHKEKGYPLLAQGDFRAFYASFEEVTLYNLLSGGDATAFRYQLTEFSEGVLTKACIRDFLKPFEAEEYIHTASSPSGMKYFYSSEFYASIIAKNLCWRVIPYVNDFKRDNVCKIDESALVSDESFKHQESVSRVKKRLEEQYRDDLDFLDEAIAFYREELELEREKTVRKEHQVEKLKQLRKEHE